MRCKQFLQCSLNVTVCLSLFVLFKAEILRVTFVMPALRCALSAVVVVCWSSFGHLALKLTIPSVSPSCSVVCRQSGPDDKDLQRHWRCHPTAGRGQYGKVKSVEADQTEGDIFKGILKHSRRGPAKWRFKTWDFLWGSKEQHRWTHFLKLIF